MFCSGEKNWLCVECGKRTEFFSYVQRGCYSSAVKIHIIELLQKIFLIEKTSARSKSRITCTVIWDYLKPFHFYETPRKFSRTLSTFCARPFKHIFPHFFLFFSLKNKLSLFICHNNDMNAINLKRSKSARKLNTRAVICKYFFSFARGFFTL